MSRPAGVLIALTLAVSVVPPVFCDASSPDYSKQALLTILRERDLVVERQGLEVYRGRTWSFRWVPLLAPIIVNDGPDGGGSILAMVNPFRLLGVDFPARSSSHLPEAEPDDLSFGERRARRQLVATVRALNAAENGH